jgi:hypothetical protein
MPITINGSTGIAGIDGSAGTPALQGSDTNTGIFFPAADTVALTTAGTEVVRTTSDGYLRMAASTGGIQFNGDTAAVNALDDYEEGTWTPTVAGATTAGTGTYTTQVGSYTKIGNRICVQGRVTWTALTGSAGTLRIGGLPFTSSSVANSFHPVSLRVADLTQPADSTLQCYVLTNSTQFSIDTIASGGGAPAGLTVDTAADIIFAGHYYI